ncbi:MAG: hypothetical protein QG570_232 [Patescibacteria group bacterium]|nr:hypothetical protein [Patescibacteria group bacterium]MDQ5981483.1 hypothetical protein [Patescibacteria group bacterium]
MYTKEQLIVSIQNEFRIIKHLADKIPVDTEGYKPTEGQRTTLELLQYLSIIFVAATTAVQKNDTSVFALFTERSKQVTLSNFAEMMDMQEAELVVLIASFTDADLETVINLYNQGEKTKGVYLVESLLKWSAAYKTQLFLYIKSSGNSSIGTSNLWGGIDMPSTLVQ